MKISDLILELTKTKDLYGDLSIASTCNKIGGVSFDVTCSYKENVSYYDEKEKTFLNRKAFVIEGNE